MDGTGKVVWTIQTGVYPDTVDAWQSSVFWSVSYLGTDGIVHAYEAGQSTPKWLFDPNVELSLPAPLTRPYLSVLGDDLFVGVHEHVFRLDPSSGKVLRRWDLSALTGVPFESNQGDALFSGGIDEGTFAADAATLVVGFESHLVALDRSSGDLLWHAATDAFPSDPFPLVRDGLLVVTANEGLAGPRPQKLTESADSGCSLSTNRHSAWWLLLAVAVAMGSFRRRAG